LDIGVALHRNPDGTLLPGRHLHVYREGYGDKFAIIPPANAFPNLEDIWSSLDDFMKYCNIIRPPIINKGLI